MAPAEPVLGKCAVESFREFHLQRLYLIVRKAFLRLAVEALLTVEQVAGLIPHVAQVVDVEGVFLIASLHNQLASVLNRIANLGKTDATILEELTQFELMLVFHLDDDTRILGKECLHDVAVGTNIVQVDVHSTPIVGETHLQQCGNQSTGRNVMSGYNPSLLNELLYGIEAIGKILRILHRRHIIAHLTQTLGKGRSAEALLIEREVDMIDAGIFVAQQHGAHHLLDILHLAAGTHDDCSRRDNLLAIGILLAQRERVFSGRHVDVQVAAEVRQGFHAFVQTGILAFLRAARPHPVSRQADAVESLGKRCPHNVGQCLGYRQHTACCRRSQSGLRSMSQCCGNTFFSTIVECHHTTVAQRKLNHSLALLTGNLTCHRAVHLVGEPVFAGYSLQLQHALQILMKLICKCSILRILIIIYHCIMTLYGLIAHDGLGRVAEHLCHIKVERFHAVGLLEREVGVAGSLTYHIERGTLALGNLAHMLNMFLVDEQSHALLTLVGNNLFGTQCLVANGKLAHIYLAATFLDQLRKTVQMACRTVVVNAHYGVVIFFAECTHQVVGAFLHFGVCALNGIQLNAIAVAAGIYRRHRASTQTNAIVVATDNHHLIAFLGLFLQAVALGTIAHAACQHDHLVVGILSPTCCLRGSLLMLESEYGTADERLTELVSEIRGTVRSLDQYLLRRLIEPLANGQDVFPVACGVVIIGKARIGRHVDRRTGNRPRACSATHTVANLSTRTCGSTVEGLHCGGEVVGLGLQRDDTLDVLHAEVVAC